MPSRDDLAYLNVHTVEDSVKYGRLRLRNIPITHNKSPTRWRNVRTSPIPPRAWQAKLMVCRNCGQAPLGP